MITPAADWERRLTRDLDNSQREAVLTPAPRVLVLASAGAGKTRVLTHRLAYLHRRFPRASLLAVTFTNRAAEEMKTRAAALVGCDSALPRRLWISTFHSFCARVLRRYGHHIRLPRDYIIADEYLQRKVFDDIVRGLGRDPKEYRRLYRGWRRMRVDHAEPPPDTDPLLAQIWRRYLRTLRDMKTLDFADLQHETLRLLESCSEVRTYLQDMFLSMLVDEFQDTNAPQYRLLTRLRPPDRSFFVVGDQDQSIYGFRGSQPENFRFLLRDYPDTVTIPLKYNYRTRRRIVHAAMNLIARNPGRIPHTVEARREGGGIRVHPTGTERQEAARVAEIVAELQETEPDLDAAILVRARSQLPALEQGLRARGISYRVIGLRSWWESPPVRAVLDYLAFRRDPEVDAYLLAVCNVPSRGLGSAAVRKLQRYARERGVANLWSALKTAASEGEFPTPGWRRFYEDAERWLRRGSETSPEQWIRELVEELERHWRIPPDRRAGYRERWRELLSLAQGVQTWDEAVEQLTLRSVDELDLEPPRIAGDRVRIMTVHAAKGLEFDVVILPGVEDGLHPHFLAQSPEEVLEERRVFFVAMTRARHQVHLCYARVRHGRPTTPSPFFDDIPEEALSDGKPRIRERGPKLARRAGSEPSREDAAESWQPGEWVQHPKFGKGIIRRVTGRGDRTNVVVWFTTGETRTFRLHRSPLKRWGKN